MSVGIPGNAVVVNFLMRWPILIPAAAAVGITTVAVEEIMPPPAPAAVITEAPAAPPEVTSVIVVPKVIQEPTPLEFLCPPVQDTVKMSAEQKKNLRMKGCKIRG